MGMSQDHKHGHVANVRDGSPVIEVDIRNAYDASEPLVIFSPIGGSLGLPGTPPFGLSMGMFGFLLATPVVWWGGWPFIPAAWRALRLGEVNMMTLIALGILVSYVYSAAATFLFSGEVFYEAVTMLTSFSLAGRWLETRSRFATGKAEGGLWILR